MSKQKPKQEKVEVQAESTSINMGMTLRKPDGSTITVADIVNQVKEQRQKFKPSAPRKRILAIKAIVQEIYNQGSYLIEKRGADNKLISAREQLKAIVEGIKAQKDKKSGELKYPFKFTTGLAVKQGYIDYFVQPIKNEAQEIIGKAKMFLLTQKAYDLLGVTATAPKAEASEETKESTEEEAPSELEEALETAEEKEED